MKYTFEWFLQFSLKFSIRKNATIPAAGEEYFLRVPLYQLNPILIYATESYFIIMSLWSWKRGTRFLYCPPHRIAARAHWSYACSIHRTHFLFMNACAIEKVCGKKCKCSGHKINGQQGENAYQRSAEGSKSFQVCLSNSEKRECNVNNDIGTISSVGDRLSCVLCLFAFNPSSAIINYSSGRLKCSQWVAG